MMFSSSYQAKYKRIKNLPTLMNDIMMGKLKKDAIGLIDEFQKGIRKNDLGLIGLTAETVANKTNQGMSRPTAPLYGKGDERKDDSYINLLRIRKLKAGWKVYPSWKMHWSGNIKLRDLFTVHEYGTKIVTKSGAIIQIPPRPAFLLSYRRWMSMRKKDEREASSEVKQAITDHINNGDIGRARRFINKKAVKLQGNVEGA